MFKLFLKGIACLSLGMTSIVALAAEMDKVYASAQEIQIPGYTAPAPSSPTSQSNAAPTQPEATQLNDTMSPDTFPQPFKASPTAEEMHKSCERFVAPKQLYEEIIDNFKNDFDQGDSGDIYQWTREGEPDLVITFLGNNNTPIAVSGNLPTNLANAKEMHFSLNDVQQALNYPGKLVGRIHVFAQKKGPGKLTVYTDGNGIVTKFTTDFECAAKKI